MAKKLGLQQDCHSHTGRCEQGGPTLDFSLERENHVWLGLPILSAHTLACCGVANGVTIRDQDGAQKNAFA
jgi:hypothetical protein